jgi:hypothetical protein
VGSAVTFGELGQLFGEELPSKTVLSAVSPTGADHPIYRMLVRSEHGTTVAYACQFRQDAASPSLLTTLGLASRAPGYAITCIPAGMYGH